MGYRQTWESATLVAECEYEWSASHLDVDVQLGTTDRCRLHLALGDCYCGIYSVKGRESLNESTNDPYVIAECVNYGWVIPHAYGYRSEKTRITKMWLRHVEPTTIDHVILADSLSQSYGVPVELVGRGLGFFPANPYLSSSTPWRLSTRVSTHRSLGTPTPEEVKGKIAGVNWRTGTTYWSSE